jgi:CBS domain-containing protein
MASNFENLKVTDVASTSYIALDEDVLVADAAKALYEQGGCSIIVTRKASDSGSRAVVGIITERDIILRIVAQNKGPFKVTLKQVMSSPLVTIDSEKTTKDALDLLKKSKINRLPVITKDGKLIGLITTEMLAKKIPTDRLSLA